jgi:N-methylhydantoinase A
MLATAPRIDVARTRLMLADEAGVAAALALFGELEAEADARFDEAMRPLTFTRSAEMRYRGQEHTVTVAWPAGLRSAVELIPRFAAAHERAYTFRLDGTAVEIVTCEVSARGPSAAVNLTLALGKGDPSAGSRPLIIEGVVEDAPVFDRAALTPGQPYPGPALVEEPTATTLVLPGQRLSVDPFGSLVIEEA